ncbi:MAG: serine hydrolase [Erythrobacter sp.]|nr:serine hydrolase [Erythrobacter sp.]
MREAGFSGEIAIAFAPSDRSQLFTSTAIAQDAEGNHREAGLPWRWASVTKQVIAVLIMQEVARGKIALDAPLSRYLPEFGSPHADRITVRQLLRHQSGLPNPDDTTADTQGVPDFYTPGFAGSRDPLTGYCAGSPKGKPGGQWEYNNCDYMVAGALLEAVTGQSWQSLLDQRKRSKFSEIDSAAPRNPLIGVGPLTSVLPVPEPWPGSVAGKPEPAFDIQSFGAAGALYGTAFDLVAFDLLLANGFLLPPEALAELWDGQPELGFMALGQWAFEAPLKGCHAAVRIIERRGGIGGIEVRNFILPDSTIALAMFTDQGDFEFGEVWQGKGFSYDMLSLAACPQVTS